MPPAESDILLGVPDSILVARAIDQDDDAFAEIVRRHAPSMRAYALRVLGCRSLADDAVQDALLTAWRQLDRLRQPGALRVWLLRIAGHRAILESKRRPAHSDLDDVESPPSPLRLPEEIAIHNAQLASLAVALDRLSADQRQCWLLRELSELSYAEIAAEMGISTSTVRGNLARARANLSVQMEEWR